MVDHLYQGVMITICVYTLARVMNHLDETRKIKQKIKTETERLKKVAALYGRED